MDSRQLLESVHDAVLIFDPATEEVIEANDRACELYGFPRHELIGMSLRSISKDVHAGTLNLRATLASESNHSFQTVQFRRDGREMVLEVNASMLDYGGRRAVLSINRDVTEKVEMLQRLEVAAAEWQTTVDALNASVLLVDEELRIVRANLRAVELAGAIDPASIPGRSLTELNSSEPWRRAAQIATLVMQERLPLSVHVSDDHSRRVWEIDGTLAPPRDKRRRAVLIIRDVTNIVDMEASLRRSEKMAEMGQLVYGVAHEVRNPLFIISASLDALETRLPNPDERTKRLRDNLRQEIARLTNLMQDLLDYGKAPALDVTVAPLDALVAQAANGVMSMGEEKQVRIDNEFPPGLSKVLMDASRLYQALHNLLANAIHYSPRGGRVRIGGRETTQGEQTWIVCTIEDCGKGFAEEDLPRVFEPFFSKRPGGTGLGLSIVRRAVEIHGGKVHATNRAEGGARFTIELPKAG